MTPLVRNYCALVTLTWLGEERDLWVSGDIEIDTDESSYTPDRAATLVSGISVQLRNDVADIEDDGFSLGDAMRAEDALLVAALEDDTVWGDDDGLGPDEADYAAAE